LNSGLHTCKAALHLDPHLQLHFVPFSREKKGLFRSIVL
jgi:hypothetical protein